MEDIELEELTAKLIYEVSKRAPAGNPENYSVIAAGVKVNFEILPTNFEYMIDNCSGLNHLSQSEKQMLSSFHQEELRKMRDRIVESR